MIGVVRAEDQVSTELAYRAMVIFSEKYYDRGGGLDTLAHVMSSISTYVWGDGTPNDPAMWADWLDAIDIARKELQATTVDEGPVEL